MKLRPLTVEMCAEMADVVRTNPWRIFCEGIFQPCARMQTREMTLPFDGQLVDPDLSRAVVEGNRLQGFAAAREKDDQILLFLLEARRGAAFAPTLAALLSEIRSLADKRNIADIGLVPQKPLSSGFNLKDDDALAVLFGTGFSYDLALAAEMRLDLNDYRVPARVGERSARLAGEGLVVTPCDTRHLDALDRLCQWRNPAPHAYGALVADVVGVDPRLITTWRITTGRISFRTPSSAN